MGNQTAKEAAALTGVSASNFTRWKKGARADPDFVVKIARAYNSSVLRALVEAEFITEEEAGADIATAEFSYYDKLAQATASAKVATNLFEAATEDVRRFHAVQIGGNPEEVQDMTLAEVEKLINKLRGSDSSRDDLALRRLSKATPAVEPLSDEELEEAVRDANARPRAAHPADDIEYTEPEFP